MPDPEDRSFDPNQPETNLARQQGAGFGEKELRTQQDPTRSNASDVLDDEVALADEAEGPIEGLQQGRTNTNREFEDESDDEQGAKTTEANRERVRGAEDMNP